MTSGNDIGGTRGEEDIRRVVAALVERCDRLEATNQDLLIERAADKLEIQALRDEIARLKGDPPRPRFKSKPSGMEKSTSPTPGKKRSKRRRGAVQSKLTVSRDVTLKAAVPDGSRFKGYEDVLVQDLRLEVDVIRYRREIWRGPDGKRIAAELPAGILGGFGPELRRFITAGHFQGQITSERLCSMLNGMGLAISKRQVVRLLSRGLDDLVAEDRAILATGISTAQWINVDDTSAPHARKNGYVTHLGDRRFAVFRSSFSKSRRNFLNLLQAGISHFVVNDEALAKMREMNLASEPIAVLEAHEAKHFESPEAWQAHLCALGFDKLSVTPDPTKVATEGALWGALCEQGLLGDTAIVSDGAGQFRVGSNHALCWVHAERLVHKLHPRSKKDREALELIRTLIWWFYADLKAWQKHPDPKRGRALRVRFDRIFARKTGFVMLDRQLARLYRQKNDLLRVLTRPEIPLHTNGSENDIRSFVTKRKISGGTVSEQGRIARDIMLGLIKTCAKLGVSFYQFLGDRFAVPGAPSVPWLPDLVSAAPA
ncbi:transposase [Sphingobium sp. EM0848]|uniref:IS66 family transposase n=1 Tax=Sphingobium sp. EM0848 TaxID=2743473 RepID=UPI001C3FB37F|nr:transposase [Sphingobium sp. EM0848]